MHLTTSSSFLIMPFDYIKYQLTGSNAETVKKTLSFEGKWNQDTGEVYGYPLTYDQYDQEYHVEIKGEEYAIVKGSLHKAANEGFNHADFTINDVAEEVIRWVSHTGINPYDTHLTTIEYGVNVITPWRPEKLIERICFQGNKWYTDMKTLGKNAVYNEWRVKAYSKIKQWPFLVEDNVFRFENHYRNSAKIFGVTGLHTFTLIDLFNTTALEAFRDDLNRCWTTTYVIDDSFARGSLRRSERAIINAWDNPLELRKLISTNPRKFRYQRGKIMDIIESNSTVHYHKKTGDLISSKLDELLVMNESTLADIQHLKQHFKLQNFVAFDTSI